MLWVDGSPGRETTRLHDALIGKMGLSLGSTEDRGRCLDSGQPPVGRVAGCDFFFFFMHCRGLSRTNRMTLVLVGWSEALRTSSIAASVYPRGVVVDFVGGMVVHVLDCRVIIIVDAKSEKK